MTKTRIADLIPENSLDLVRYSGNELINRLGENIIMNVVRSILCGDNVRNLTEGLTQRRVLLMNASLMVTYLKALDSYEDLSSSLTSIVANEMALKRITDYQKRYLLWFVGLTGKSIQNVIREKDNFEDYLDSLDKNLSDISEDIKQMYGDIGLTASYNGIEHLLKWPDLLRCMLALGAQTLTIRGSEKSMYGKLFEKFVLGSALTILGFEYIDHNEKKDKNVFWLSERKDKRESDATVLLKPGFGIKFDIGFIGSGNTEVSLDKVSRFERTMEHNGKRNNIATIILVDKIGSRSRIERMASDIDGHIIQMSGTYWMHKLAETIKEVYPFYNNPILNMSKEDSLKYLTSEMEKINLAKFLKPPLDKADR